MAWVEKRKGCESLGFVPCSCGVRQNMKLEGKREAMAFEAGAGLVQGSLERLCELMNLHSGRTTELHLFYRAVI